MSATWKVNGYDAAACVSSAEINRKMEEVFDTTDRLPKTWQNKDRDAVQIDATLQAPSVQFIGRDNYVVLRTPIVKGTYSAYTLDFSTTPPKAVADNLQLNGLTIDIETDMRKVEMLGDFMLTLNALEAALPMSTEDPALLALQRALGRRVVNLWFEDEERYWAACCAAKQGMQLMRSAWETLGSEIPQHLTKPLLALVGRYFPDDKALWTACQKQFSEAKGVDAAAAADHKETILDAARWVPLELNIDEYRAQLVQAADLKTADAAFTVESLYADLENPKAIHDIGTGYLLDDTALGKDGELELPDALQAALIAGVDAIGKRLLGAIFGSADEYGAQLTHVMNEAGIEPAAQEQYLERIVAASHSFALSSADCQLGGALQQANVAGGCIFALGSIADKDSQPTEDSFWQMAAAALTAGGIDDATQAANKEAILAVANKFVLSNHVVGWQPALGESSSDHEPLAAEWVAALQPLRNRAFPDTDTYWHACIDALTQAGIDTVKLAALDISDQSRLADEKSEEARVFLTLIQVGSAVVLNPHTETKVALGTELSAIYKENSEYATSYVFGLARIPHVAATEGIFTPRRVRFTTYQSSADSTRGSINWNLVTSASEEAPELPSLDGDDGNALYGQFEHDPIPKEAVGAVYLSFEKIIMEDILPEAFAGADLGRDKWAAVPDEVRAELTVDVNAPDSDTFEDGYYAKGDTRIYPDPEQNRIKVDFVIKNLKAKDKWNDWVGINVPAMIAKDFTKLIGKEEKPRWEVSWSGYFTFTLKDDELTLTYTADPNYSARMTSEGSLVTRILSDASTLGINEWDRKVKDDLSGRYADKQRRTTGTAHKLVADVVQLPGRSVFDFSDVRVTEIGLCASLKYQDEYDA